MFLVEIIIIYFVNWNKESFYVVLCYFQIKIYLE